MIKFFRDFTYIKDVISANLIALESKCGVYNVGSGVASFQDIVDILQKNFIQINLRVYPNPYAKSYQFHTQAKLDETWGYKPKFSLEEGYKGLFGRNQKTFEKEVNA